MSLNNMMIAAWICLYAPASLLLAASTMPDLKPPRDFLLPTYWENHRWWFLGGLLFAVVEIALWICWKQKSKPVVVEPPEVVAQRRLEAMRGRPEDREVFSDVSQVTRQYLLSMLNLPGQALTTEELLKALTAAPFSREEFAVVAGNLLRECDEKKFALRSSTASPAIVPRAIDLVARIEEARKSPLVAEAPSSS